MCCSHLQVFTRGVPCQDPEVRERTELGQCKWQNEDCGEDGAICIYKGKKADTLRSYLDIHIGTINMLLLGQGLEMLDAAREERDKGQDELRDRIEDSSRELREVRGNTEAQGLAVRENNSMLRKVFWMVSGDIAAPLKALSQAVAKVW